VLTTAVAGDVTAGLKSANPLDVRFTILLSMSLQVHILVLHA
jgi:hypothetical protein